MASNSLNGFPMLPFTLALGLLWLCADQYLLKYVAEFSEFIHQGCLSHVGASRPTSPIYQALACGGSIQKSPTSSVIREMGLIHLFVFSGAHLVFAERMLNFIFKKDLYLSLSLAGLCLLSGLKAPALRALLYWSLKRLNGRFELHWPTSLTVGLTGLLCLGLAPHWWISLSLPLSWVASLSFSFHTNSKLKSFSLVYLLCLPLLLSLGPANPISIFVNLIASPLFFFFLLPASWVGGAFPSLQAIVDPTWNIFFSLLETFRTPLSYSLEKLYLSPNQRWAYVFSLQFLFYLQDLRLCRKQS